ncbi:MaoC family dehydratase [Pseudogracilibacillus auburnensis]|uniref:MaoC family dehydratase n=1 Tax=Pseudogracilibacillus auburnensis TaxID=1494959 RepID=UPI001A95F490|nr:MaoC family dehydratase [Pseudogracilibacillus auburnensis]MBO1003205.1 MaoC family dehydratase [Pseudogracilibacillus auburnensis]
MKQFSIGQKASCSKTFTETDVVLFAGLSGDFNPIHVDAEYAKQTKFKKRIAHGLLTSSLISQLLGMRLPGEGSIYLNQTMRFRLPVYIGDTVTASAMIKEINEEKNTITLVTECHNQYKQLVLEGEATLLTPAN